MGFFDLAICTFQVIIRLTTLYTRFGGFQVNKFTSYSPLGILIRYACLDCTFDFDSVC